MATFASPISSTDSILLGVSVGMDYYKGDNLQQIVDLFRRSIPSATPVPASSSTLVAQTTSTFSAASIPASSTMSVTQTISTPSAASPTTRVFLYADSLNAYNRMIYRFTYPPQQQPLSLETARLQAEQEADVWFNDDKEGRALRDVIPWSHTLRWRDVLQYHTFSASLDRVRKLYLFNIHHKERKKLEALANSEELGSVDAKFKLLFSDHVDTIVGQRVADNVQVIEAYNKLHPHGTIVFNRDEAVRLNREYLFEECAGEFTIAAMTKEPPYCIPKYVVYPGRVNAAINDIRQIIQNESLPQQILQMNPIKIPPPKLLARTELDGHGTSHSQPKHSGSLVNIAMLIQSVGLFMRELNGKYQQCQDAVAEAAVRQGSGRPMTPRLEKKLADAETAVEQLCRAKTILDEAAPLLGGSSPPPSLTSISSSLSTSTTPPIPPSLSS